MSSAGDEPTPSITEGFLSYLKARLQLLNIESLEAYEHLRQKLIPALLVAACGFLAYALILAAVVSLLGRLFLTWEVYALIFAAIHLIVLNKMRHRLLSKSQAPLFEYTRAEIEQDRQWLQNQNRSNKTS